MITRSKSRSMIKQSHTTTIKDVEHKNVEPNNNTPNEREFLPNYVTPNDEPFQCDWRILYPYLAVTTKHSKK